MPSDNLPNQPPPDQKPLLRGTASPSHGPLGVPPPHHTHIPLVASQYLFFSREPKMPVHPPNISPGFWTQLSPAPRNPGRKHLWSLAFLIFGNSNNKPWVQHLPCVREPGHSGTIALNLWMRKPIMEKKRDMKSTSVWQSWSPEQGLGAMSQGLREGSSSHRPQGRSVLELLEHECLHLVCEPESLTYCHRMWSTRLHIVTSTAKPQGSQQKLQRAEKGQREEGWAGAGPVRPSASDALSK